jgi:hypothetical protein
MTFSVESAQKLYNEGPRVSESSEVNYFSHRIRAPEAHLTLNGRNIPLVIHVIYLDVIFD